MLLQKCKRANFFLRTFFLWDLHLPAINRLSCLQFNNKYVFLCESELTMKVYSPSQFFMPRRSKIGGILFCPVCDSINLSETLTMLITFEQWELELWYSSWTFLVTRHFHGYSTRHTFWYSLMLVPSIPMHADPYACFACLSWCWLSWCWSWLKVGQFWLYTDLVTGS